MDALDSLRLPGAVAGVSPARRIVASLRPVIVSEEFISPVYDLGKSGSSADPDEDSS